MKKFLLPGVLMFLLLLFNASRLRNTKPASLTKSMEAIEKNLAPFKKIIVACAPPAKMGLLDSLEEVFTNDNRTPAGELRNGILYLSLEARTGNWYPETRDGMPIKVHAFAEV